MSSFFSRALLLGLVVVLAVVSAVPLRIGVGRLADAYVNETGRLIRGLEFYANQSRKSGTNFRLGSKAPSGSNSNSNATVYDSIVINALAPQANESAGDLYVRLAGSNDALVGPLSSSALPSVTAALNRSGVLMPLISPNGNSANQAVYESYFQRVMTIAPNSTTYTTNLIKTYPFIQDMIRASRFTWSFIIAANEGDERQQQLFAAGQAAVAELRGNPALGTSYTILDEVYVGVNDFLAMNNSLTIMANRRPTPNVLALYLPYISQEYVIAVSDVLTATKVNPDVLFFASPMIPLEDMQQPLRDRVAYWTVAGLWDKTTERGSVNNGNLGNSEQYSDDFKADNNFYPSQWEALGSASGVVLQMWIERALSLSAPMPAIKDEEIFWGKLDIRPINGSNIFTRAGYTQNYLGQAYWIGDSEAGGARHDVSAPGRWNWFSYPISGSAVGGIVIGTLFAVAGVAIAAWSTYKFVSIFLNPPTEIDMDEAAEDD
jgi:hypothetical protein